VTALLAPLRERVAEQQRHLLVRSPGGSWTFSGRERLKGSRQRGLEKALLLANWSEANLRIANKAGAEIPFRRNDAQSILLNFFARCWADRVRVEVLIPKLRQGGVSTEIQADAFSLSVLSAKAGQTFRAGTVAHIEASAKFIFGISRKFEALLPPEWKLPLESRQQGRFEWRKTGGFIQIASAKLGDALFKGVPLNLFHGSEVANWSDAGLDASVAVTSATNALAPGPDSVIALESTAKGRDAYFYREIQKALPGGRGGSAMQVVFLPWFLAEEYTETWEAYCRARPHRNLPRKFTPTPEEENLRAELRDVVVRPGEEWIRYPTELTDEQLIWRRKMIEGVECGGDEAVFRRYYPSTLEECFASTESTKFEDSVDHYEREKRPGTEGVIRRGESRLEFMAVERGPVTVWEMPRDGHEYVIGADVAGEMGVGLDYSAAYVIHKRTLTVVAAFHDKLEGDRYADALAMLGRFYNDALLAVERNHNPSVVLALARGGYPRVYRYRNPMAPKTAPKPGWVTDRKNRHVIIDGLAQVCRDRRLRSRCPDFAAEMETFVYNAAKKRYQAAPGKHDDRVIAMAIAVHLCDPRSPFLGALSVGQVNTEAARVEDGGEVYRAYLREQEEAERLERESLGGDDSMVI
jgi:hypothetical protein